MIVPIVGEELGLLGVFGLLVAFGLVAWCGYSVALRAKDPFGKLLAAGLTTLIVGQAVLNIGGTLGVLPFTGVPVPLISYGGTSLIATLAAIGLVLSVGTHGGQALQAAEPVRKPARKPAARRRTAARPQAAARPAGRSDRARAAPPGDVTTRRVLVAAGGTAGHVMPALAVAEELVPRRCRGDVRGDAGARRGGARARRAATRSTRSACAACRAVRRCGWRVRSRSTPPRRSPACASCAAAARTPCSAAGATWRAPCCWPRARSAFPRVLTEADAHLGLANRLAAPLADRVFLAYPIPGRRPPRYEVVGRPVARAYFETTRAQARAELGLPPDAFVLAVFGALAGARRINDACVAAYGATGSRTASCVHVTGHARLRARDAGRDRAAGALPGAGDDRSLLDGAGGRRSRREPRRRHRLGARGGRPARPARTLSPCHGRPSARECRALRRRRRCGDRRGRRPRRRRAARRAWPTCAPSPGGSTRCARACAAARGPTPPRPSRASCCASRGAARERRAAPARASVAPGMSGIARVLRGHGRTVSGCDRSPAAVDELRAEGIDARRRPRPGAPARRTWS